MPQPSSPLRGGAYPNSTSSQFVHTSHRAPLQPRHGSLFSPVFMSLRDVEASAGLARVTRTYTFLMRVTLTIVLVIVCSCWHPASATAQSAEKYGYEFTAGLWPLSPSGNVLSHGTTTDLRSDLGIEARVHPMIKALIKTAERHGFTFEFVPYRLNGDNTITRTFHFSGRDYPTEDKIHSEASVNYIFGGYQYDLVNAPRGYLELVAGVAYFGATVRVESQQVGTGTEQRRVPLPMIGGKFRIFPFRRDTFSFDGEVKGMSYGSFGRYIHTNVNASVAVSPHVRLQGGFNLVNGDAHDEAGTKGFKLRFAGPIFSVQLHD